jgi:hypothetical protein
MAAIAACIIGMFAVLSFERRDTVAFCAALGDLRQGIAAVVNGLTCAARSVQRPAEQQEQEYNSEDYFKVRHLFIKQLLFSKVADSRKKANGSTMKKKVIDKCPL